MLEDPWTDLRVPTEEHSISARRVDESSKWDFYWGRDTDRNCLLVLRHEFSASPRDRLPRLKGVEVSVQPGTGTVKPSLVLKLLDNSLRDIFHALCVDVIASTTLSTSEAEAVTTTIARTWRWHHLLRGGGSGLLSPEEQKGLMGELLVLEQYFMPTFSAADSVGAWLGPTGAPQDFVLGRTGIESKARSAQGANNVHISSEFQLDENNLTKLFLHVSVFDTADPAEGEGFTISDIAERLRDRLLSTGEPFCEHYDALLAAAGFRFEDDYSTFRWVGGERSIFEIRPGFPRLTSAGIPKEISAVKYILSLAECSTFVVSPATMITTLTEG